MDGAEADGVAPTSPEGDTVGEALECGVLPRCGVLLVVVGAGRVGFVVVVGVGLGAYVVGVTWAQCRPQMSMSSPGRALPPARPPG